MYLIVALIISGSFYCESVWAGKLGSAVSAVAKEGAPTLSVAQQELRDNYAKIYLSQKKQGKFTSGDLSGTSGLVVRRDSELLTDVMVRKPDGVYALTIEGEKAYALSPNERSLGLSAAMQGDMVVSTNGNLNRNLAISASSIDHGTALFTMNAVNTLRKDLSSEMKINPDKRSVSLKTQAREPRGLPDRNFEISLDKQVKGEVVGMEQGAGDDVFIDVISDNKIMRHPYKVEHTIHKDVLLGDEHVYYTTQVTHGQPRELTEQELKRFSYFGKYAPSTPSQMVKPGEAARGFGRGSQ